MKAEDYIVRRDKKMKPKTFGVKITLELHQRIKKAEKSGIDVAESVRAFLEDVCK